MGSGAFLEAFLPSSFSPTLSRQTRIVFGSSPARFHLRSFCTIRALFSNDPTPDPGPEQSGSSPQQPPDTAPRKSKRKPKEKLPNGLRRYETMAILRPDITEDERLDLTQRYEEAIIAGGGLSVEFSNRGIMPLSYSIKRKDTGGVANRYLDGIYMLFTYVTKPQSLLDLQRRFNADDDIIRSTTILMK